jgi:hypothetical protein
VAHFSGKGVEGGFFTEEFDASFFQSGFARGCINCGDRVGLNLGCLLGHIVDGELRERAMAVNDGFRL